MLLEFILSPILLSFYAIIEVLPSASFPADFISSVSHVFDVIFQNLGLLPMFVRISTINRLAPYVIFLITFEYSYRLIMWVLKKIPFINIG